MSPADFVPYLGAAGGSGGATFLATRWWAYRLQARKQSDNVLQTMVGTLQARVADLEAMVRHLENELRNSATEADSYFWLLKYCPEERRVEAVRDIERSRKERRDRMGEERQAAQIKLSAERVLGGGDAE